MVARRHFAGVGRGAHLLAVDRDHRFRRLGLDVQLARTGSAVERESDVRIAARLHLDDPLLFHEAVGGDRNFMIAGTDLARPWRDADLLAVDGNRRRRGKRGQGQARAGALADGEIESDGEIAIGRHAEEGADLAVSFELQDDFVLALVERDEERRAAALLAVEDDLRADRLRLDRQRRRLGQRGEGERNVGVAALAGDQLALLAHAAVHLDCDHVLARRELALERRAAHHRAVDEDVGVGRIALDRERGRTAGVAQLDQHVLLLLARLDVELLFGAAAVGGGDRDRVRTREQWNGQRRLADVVVVDLDARARLDGAERVGHRFRRRVEGDAVERLARRAQPGGAAFLVLGFDEVFERTFGKDRGRQIGAEALLALVFHGESFVPGGPGLAGEDQRREEVRRVADLGLDEDPQTARGFLQRVVLDLGVLRFRGGVGLALRSGRFLVHCQQDSSNPGGIGGGGVCGRRSGNQDECEVHVPPHHRSGRWPWA